MKGIGKGEDYFKVVPIGAIGGTRMFLHIAPSLLMKKFGNSVNYIDNSNSKVKLEFGLIGEKGEKATFDDYGENNEHREDGPAPTKKAYSEFDKPIKFRFQVKDKVTVDYVTCWLQVVFGIENFNVSGRL